MMRDIRISLASIVTFLLCIGVVMIYSSSGIYALQELGDGAYYLNRHLMFLVIGTAFCCAAMMFDYRELRKWAKPLLGIAFLLLVLVLIPGIGKSISGARRWFQFAGFSFQPSEFAKLALLIYVSDYLARKQTKISDFWTGFLPVIMILGAMALLVVKQPDFGSSVLMGVIVMTLLFLAGFRALEQKIHKSLLLS